VGTSATKVGWGRAGQGRQARTAAMEWAILNRSGQLWRNTKGDRCSVPIVDAPSRESIEVRTLACF
jgi:hypothetical protein